MAGRFIYLLSPANCSGKRAGWLLRPGAASELAMRLRTPAGVPLGEVFAFISGLYFRGKRTYGERFGERIGRWAGCLVITPGRGLVDSRQAVTLSELQCIAEVRVDLEEPAYLEPLLRDARKLRRSLRRHDRVVLLGSIASDKYRSILLEALGDRLYFPDLFVGRGDMSRGGLMLRCARAGEQLSYVPLQGAATRGKRPAKLAPLRRAG